MVTLALYVRLEAKPGKEKDVEAFLKGGLPLVQEEAGTIAWFGIRLGPLTFGILTLSPMKRDVRRIFRERLPLP